MKKINLISLLYVVLFSIIFSANAYSQSGQKWASGGNSPSGNDFLGTNNSFPIVFKTNGTEQMRLLPNGNLGIGTNNPGEKLEINGNLKLSGNLIIGGQFQFGSGAFFYSHKIKTSRIVSPDSIVFIGDSSLAFNAGNGLIYNDNSSVAFPQGLALNSKQSVAKAPFSTAIGPYTHTILSAFNSVVIGAGISLGNPMANTKANSLMVGFNSNIPTLYVGPGSGTNTLGNVAIGTTNPNPHNLLQVESPNNTQMTVYANSLTKSAIIWAMNNKFSYGLGIDASGVGHIYGNINYITQPDNYMSFVNGKVGIGTDDPAASMHIHNGTLMISDDPDGSHSKYWTTGHWRVRMETPVNSAWVTTDASSESNKYMGIGMTTSGWYFICSDGAPGDQTKDPKIPFCVSTSGKLNAREVEVTMSNWPDFVFDNKYEKLPLAELEKYVKANKHLPGVPSEAEVKTNGLNLGEMDAVLLKKMEEMTLYILDLKKENDLLKERIDKLEKK